MLLSVFLYTSDTVSFVKIGQLATSWWSIVIILLLVLQNILVALRWWFCVRILKGYFSIKQAIHTTLIGIFYSNVLPSAVGLEGYRLLVGKLSGMSLRTMSFSIILEKIAGLVPLTLVVFVLPSLVPDDSQWSRFAYLSVIIYVAVIMLATFLAFSRRLRRYFRTRFTVIKEQRLSGRYIPSLVISSIASNVLLIIGMILSWLIVIGELPSPAQISLFPIIVIISALPISVGGWGLREGALISLYAGTSLSFDQALSVGLLYGAMQSIASLIGLIVHVIPETKKSEI